MKIVICDNDIHFCEEIERMIAGYGEIQKRRIETLVFYSGESLCTYLEQCEEIDILFLDIEFEQMSGIDVGEHIRKHLGNHWTQIVFISGEPGYAMRLFKVQPMDFLIKPVHEDDIIEILKTCEDLLKKKKKFFEFSQGTSEKKVRFEEIVGFISDGRKIIIKTINGKEEFYGKLKEIVSELPDNFLQIHQSYIINEDYITTYKYDHVEIMNGESFIISKPYRNAIRKKLLMRKGNNLC